MNHNNILFQVEPDPAVSRNGGTHGLAIIEGHVISKSRFPFILSILNFDLLFHVF